MTAREIECFKSFKIPGGIHGYNLTDTFYKTQEYGEERHASKSQLKTSMDSYVTICCNRKIHNLLIGNIEILTTPVNSQKLY